MYWKTTALPLSSKGQLLVFGWKIALGDHQSMLKFDIKCKLDEYIIIVDWVESEIEKKKFHYR